MTEIRNPERDAAARLAAAHAVRPPVDNNGRPLGPPAVYTYDAAGKLISAEVGTEDGPS
jgi:hypothetical protein